jgi:hypothetical protein
LPVASTVVVRFDRHGSCAIPGLQNHATPESASALETVEASAWGTPGTIAAELTDANNARRQAIEATRRPPVATTPMPERARQIVAVVVPGVSRSHDRTSARYPEDLI